MGGRRGRRDCRTNEVKRKTTGSSVRSDFEIRKVRRANKGARQAAAAAPATAAAPAPASTLSGAAAGLLASLRKEAALNKPQLSVVEETPEADGNAEARAS